MSFVDDTKNTVLIKHVGLLHLNGNIPTADLESPGVQTPTKQAAANSNPSLACSFRNLSVCFSSSFFVCATLVIAAAMSKRVLTSCTALRTPRVEPGILPDTWAAAFLRTEAMWFSRDGESMKERGPSRISVRKWLSFLVLRLFLVGLGGIMMEGFSCVEVRVSYCP